ncbi:MAG: hypothetical protein DRI57_32960, partial [Deltaproteobacteria bacterium]
DNTEFGDGKMVLEILGADNTEDVLGFSDGVAFADGIGGTVVSDGSEIGTYLWNQATSKLTLDIGSDSTPANVSTLLQNISYYNLDTVDPSSHDRTVRVVMWDGDGDEVDNVGLSSNVADVTVHVQPINDAPQISNLDGDTVQFFEEDGPILIDQIGSVGTDTFLAATVSDSDSDDFDGGSLEVEITGGGTDEDVLGIREAGGITYNGFNVTYQGDVIGEATYVQGTKLLDVDLNPNATSEAVNALIQNITFDNTDTGNPLEGDRTIRFTLDDGDLGAPITATVTVNVSGVNDAPEIQNLDGDAVIYTEGNAAGVAIDDGSNATVLDLDTTDFDGGMLHVQITSGFGADTAEDVLSVNDGLTGAGNATYSADDHKLTLNLDANATKAQVNTILGDIKYVNTDSDNPTLGDRNVRIWMNDGDDSFNPPTGELTSPEYNTTVTVVGVNDSPVIDGLEGDTRTYIENDSAAMMMLDSDAALAVVTDDDSADFDGGRLEVQITSGLEKDEDVLSIANDGYVEPGTVVNDGAQTAAANISYNGNEVFFGGKVIGTGAYDADTGKLDIDLTAEATTEGVSALIQNISYANTDSDDPKDGNRTIDFKLIDGDGDAFGAGETTVSVTVGVSAVNDAPEIFNVEGDVVPYAEGADPVMLDVGADATVLDPDTTDFNGGKLEVQISTDLSSATDEDTLGINHVGYEWDQIAYDENTSDVSYGGVKIGDMSFTKSNGLLTVDFNSVNANNEAVSALIQNITYDNIESIDPTPGDRRVTFTLSDGDTDTPANASSEPVGMIVSVEAVNSAPVITDIDSDDTQVYVEGDPAKPIDVGTDAFVSDADSDDFEGGHLKVQILNP